MLADSLIASGTSLLNTTINGLFNAGKTKAETERIQAQRNQIDQDTRLSLLSNSQKQYLAEQMAAANTTAQREKLIADAVQAVQVATINGIASVKAAQAQSQGKTIIYITLGVGFAAIIAVILLKQKD